MIPVAHFRDLFRFESVLSGALATTRNDTLFFPSAAARPGIRAHTRRLRARSPAKRRIVQLQIRQRVRAHPPSRKDRRRSPGNAEPAYSLRAAASDPAAKSDRDRARLRGPLPSASGAIRSTGRSAAVPPQLRAARRMLPRLRLGAPYVADPAPGTRAVRFSSNSPSVRRPSRKSPPSDADVRPACVRRNGSHARFRTAGNGRNTSHSRRCCDKCPAAATSAAVPVRPQSDSAREHDRQVASRTCALPLR